MRAIQAATPDQAALLDALIDHGLLIRTGVPGLYGRGAVFEDLRLRFDELVTRTAVDEHAESMRFPPILPRRLFEHSSSTSARAATRTGASSSR
jgi:hypothetical protein